MKIITDKPALEHQIGPRGRFILRQAAGEISIRGVEGDTARVRLDGDRPLAELFDIETGNGKLELRQKERFGLGFKMFRNDAPELEIEVPHGASVLIDSASGELEASDLDGEKQFRTASGDVQLRRLAGPVEVQTVSGDINVEGQAPIDLSLRSVSGDVRVRVPRLKRLDLTTTSGDLWLDAELGGDGPFALRSISGDATIVGRSGFRVEAETITGDLSSEVPAKRESMPGRRIMVVGRPGPTLGFRSVSGDLRVVQPREAAPVMAPSAPDAPDAPEPPRPPMPPSAPAADVDAARLDILRELERGDITVAEATERLANLDAVTR
ncbi:MAG TPA: DUF4097 family beta strand repeat-containing protein [Candidatus Limnocylindrales bacterium]|nr:DUF4097 family beta strand repeat-containing protein [Candidatus Limnocylindrales bacterium]